MRIFSSIIVLLVAAALPVGGCGEAGSGPFPEGGFHEELTLAVAQQNPSLRRQSLLQLVEDLEPWLSAHRSSRLAYLEALGALAGTEAVLGNAASATATRERIVAEAWRLLAADPADGALRGRLATGLGVDGRIDEGWRLLMEGKHLAAGEAASQRGLLRAGNVLLSLLRARGQPERATELQAACLSLVRGARAHAEAGSDRAFRVEVIEAEAQLLLSMGRLAEVPACLHELEQLGADGLASLRLARQLEELSKRLPESR